MTIASIGMRRMKPRPGASGWRPRALRIRPTGCGPTTATRAQSIAAQFYSWRACRRHGSLSTGHKDANVFRLRGTDFVVQDGRIDVSESALLTGPEGVLRVFALVAAHGYRLDTKCRRPPGPMLCRCSMCTSPRDRSYGTVYARSCSDLTLRTRCAPCMPSASWNCLSPSSTALTRWSFATPIIATPSTSIPFLVIDNVHALRQPQLAWNGALRPCSGDRSLDLFFSR